MIQGASHSVIFVLGLNQAVKVVVSDLPLLIPIIFLLCIAMWTSFPGF